LAAADVFTVEVATWHGLVLIATEREPLLDLDEIGNGTKTNVVRQGFARPWPTGATWAGIAPETLYRRQTADGGPSPPR
jgi:hypothetical protein